jgi:hypothetical protein
MLIDMLVPANRPSVKLMRSRSGGAFIAQSISHPQEITISTKGIPRMITHMNKNRDERFPFIKQCIYACCWGERSTTRGYVFRWADEGRLKTLKSQLPDASWVVVP